MSDTLKNGRIEVTLKFSVNLDHFAGWGHEPADWLKYIENNLTRDRHYEPKVEVIEVRGGWKRQDTPTGRLGED